MVGIDLDCVLKFLRSAWPLLELHRRLRQPVVGLVKALIHLDCVLKLNGGLAVFPFVEITLATLQIFLLAYVWIAVAPSHQRDRNKQDDQRNERRISQQQQKIEQQRAAAEPRHVRGFQHPDRVQGGAQAR